MNKVYSYMMVTIMAILSVGMLAMTGFGAGYCIAQAIFEYQPIVANAIFTTVLVWSVPLMCSLFGIQGTIETYEMEFNKKLES